MNSTEVNTTVPFNPEDQISNVPPSVATQVTSEVLGLCFIVGILACVFYAVVRYCRCCKRDIHDCSNTTSGSSSFSEKEEPLKKVDEDVVGPTRVSFSGPPLHNLSTSCPVFLIMEGIETKEYNNGKLVSNDEEKEVEKGTEGVNVDCKEGDNEIEMKENEEHVLSEEKEEEEAEEKEVYCKTEGQKVIYIEMEEFKNGKPISKEEEKKEDEQEEGAEGQDKNEVEGAEEQDKSEAEGAEEQDKSEVEGAEEQDKNEVQVEKKDEDNEKKENEGQDGLDGTEIEEIDMEPKEGSLETPCQTEEDEEERAFRQVVEYLTGRNFVNSNAPPPCFRPPVLKEAEELREVAVGVTRNGHVAVSMEELTETSSSEEENGNHQAENPEEDEEFQAVIVPRTDYQRFILQALEISSSEVSDAMDEDATDADREDNDEDKEEVKRGENGNKKEEKKKDENGNKKEEKKKDENGNKKEENGNKKEENKKDENGNKKENDENGTEGIDCGKEMEDGKMEGGMAEGKEGEKQEKNEERDEDEQTYNFIVMSYEEEKEKDGDQNKEGRGGLRDGSSESVYFSYHDDDDEEDEAEFVKWTRRQPATPPYPWSPAPRLHQLRAAMKDSQDLRTYRLAREAYVRAVSALGLTMPGRIPHPDLRLREDRIQDSYSPLETSVAAATAGVVMVESHDPTCLAVIP